MKIFDNIIRKLNKKNVAVLLTAIGCLNFAFSIIYNYNYTKYFYRKNLGYILVILSGLNSFLSASNLSMLNIINKQMKITFNDENILDELNEEEVVGYLPF